MFIVSCCLIAEVVQFQVFIYYYLFLNIMESIFKFCFVEFYFHLHRIYVFLTSFCAVQVRGKQATFTLQ